ncbi:MAG: TldD/PmbA family protein, partial [Rhizobacter sp.]|nr:TldD/PmbA family protein [Chlorobiales bacterium]
MPILSKEDTQAILKKVLSYSKADECSASLGGTKGGNIRYARNSVSTSGTEINMTLGVTAMFGKRSGASSINEFDDASLRKVVQRAEELAKLAPENPESMPVLEPQQYLETKAAFEATAKIDAEYRAKAAADSIEPCRAKGLTAAGFLEHSENFAAIMNSKNLFAYNRSTGVNFSVTVRTDDGTGSGYATRDYNDAAKLNTGEASQIAIDKALQSRTARAIEPGKYTVILEPAALFANTDASLLGAMINSMDARSADEGRSFYSKPGGGNKLGERIVDERITITSDPTNPDIPASPWSGDGRAREKTTWIEKGVVKNLFYARYWAKEKNVKAVPTPAGIVVAGGDASLEDLIKDTKKGILVTRLWYIRPVDPQTLL